MLLSRYLKAIYNRLIRISIRASRFELGSVQFRGRPIIFQAPGSKIHVGDRTVIVSKSVYTALGLSSPTILRTLKSGAKIEIGSDVGISGAVICAATSVSIGDRCLLGSGAKIVDTDFHPISSSGRRYERDWSKIASAPVKLGNDVFVGAGAMILKGVKIGNGSVIGAGAVVTRNVPPNSIVAGNPARVIGSTD